MNESNATVKVGKGMTLTTVPSADASDAIALGVGENALKVEVTAQDGTKKTYTVTVTRQGAPDAPTNLRASAGNQKLDLTWTAPWGTVTGYDVHYTMAGPFQVSDDAPAVSGGHRLRDWVAVSHSGTTASKSITNLENGAPHRVRVRAVNAAGESAWAHGTGTPQGTPASGDATLNALSGSTSTDGNTFGGTLTLSPSFARTTNSYTATVANSVTHVKLTPAANHRSHKRVQVRKGAGTWATVASGSASDAFTLDAGENTFSISVDAENGSTRVYTVTITRQPPAGAPTNLRVTSGFRKLDLTWTAPTGGTVTGYDVHYTSSATVAANEAAGSNPAMAWVAVSRTGKVASQTIPGLTNNTPHRVRVRVQGGTGRLGARLGHAVGDGPAGGAVGTVERHGEGDQRRPGPGAHPFSSPGP